MEAKGPIIPDELYSEKLQDIISSFQTDVRKKGLFIEREQFYENGDYWARVGSFNYEFPTGDDPNLYKKLSGPSLRVFFHRNGSQKRNDMLHLLQISDVSIAIPKTYDVHASLEEIEDLGKIINKLRRWARESEK